MSEIPDDVITAAQRILDFCIESKHAQEPKIWGRACWKHRESALVAMGWSEPTRRQRAKYRRLIDRGVRSPDRMSDDASELSEYVRFWGELA